jgi:hypothetical protein
VVVPVRGHTGAGAGVEVGVFSGVDVAAGKAVLAGAGVAAGAAAPQAATAHASRKTEPFNRLRLSIGDSGLRYARWWLEYLRRLMASK